MLAVIWLPLSQEGTLQVGDQLISIDGQKILGYSFEKARHLLQQARARGWVQLIVTSRGGAAAGGPAGVEGAAGGGNLRSSVPESVVLRQKKRSKGSEWWWSGMSDRPIRIQRMSD